MRKQLRKIETVEEAKGYILELRKLNNNKNAHIHYLRCKLDAGGDDSAEVIAKLKANVRNLQKELDEATQRRRYDNEEFQKLRSHISHLEHVVRCNNVNERTEKQNKNYQTLLLKLVDQDKLVEDQAQQIRDLESARKNAGFMERLRYLFAL